MQDCLVALETREFFSKLLTEMFTSKSILIFLQDLHLLDTIYLKNGEMQRINFIVRELSRSTDRQ
jgi:hypothetical protein